MMPAISDAEATAQVQAQSTVSATSTAIPAASTVTLLPEILARVIRHLDPTVKMDMTALLVVQRSSRLGWDTATPIIYQHIEVFD